MNFEFNSALREGASEAVRREAWLLGQPTLRKYLDFIEEMRVDDGEFARRAAVDEWRAANDYYYDLEESEAGWASQTDVKNIDPSLNELAAMVRADPRFKRVFNSVPTRFAMLELDRLIVSQPHINVDHACRLEAEFGVNPSSETIFRRCMELDGPSAPVEMRKVGSSRFVFCSSSSDLRFQEPVLLRADQIVGHDGYGPLGGCIGLMVGFSSNFLNVVQSDDRYVIDNGHHRAYALRRMGFTHAPCIVECVTRLGELELVGSSNVVSHPEFYFKAARPPLLKDFFDPRICKILRVRKLMQMVEIKFEVKDYEFKELALTERI